MCIRSGSRLWGYKFVLFLCLLGFLTACSSSEEKSVEYLNRANEYYEQGKFAEAKLEAKNAIKLDPKASNAFLILGNCSVKEQNWRGAFGAYSKAVELDPSLIEAQLGLGRIYLLSRQLDKTNEVVDKVLEIAPHNIEAHLLRSATLIQKEDYDGALRILAGIKAEHPGNIDAVLGMIAAYEKKGDNRKANEILSSALKEKPNNNVLQYKAASLAEGAGDYAAAEKHYFALLKSAEDKAPIQLMIARLYERAGQLEKAESMLSKLISENPDNVDYRMGLAGLHVRSEKYGKAIAVIDAAPQDSDSIQLELAKVDVLIGQKDFAQAIELLESVSEKNDDHPLSSKALSKLGALYLNNNNYNDALEVLNQAISKNPDPETLQLRAQAHLALGDIDGAIADLQVVRKELPDNYAARQLLARAYLAQDKGLMAVEELHDILERNAEYSPSRNLLVTYYARYGQWDLAEEELSRLLIKTPEDPSLLIAMGDVKRVQKDYESARQYYKSVLNLKEGKGPALLRLGVLAEMDKNYTQALGYYEEALSLHPKSAAAIERKLFTLYSSGHLSEMAEYQNYLLKTLPENPVLHDMFGRLAMAQGDNELAKREFRKASRLAPEWGVPYQRLIGVYMASGNTDQIIKECQAVLDEDPDAYIEEFLLGQIYQMNGEVSKAEGAYASVLEKRPDFMPAANNLAYVYAENYSDTETLEKGLELAKKAAADGNPEALDTLGWLYHLLGNREQSIEVLNKAYEKDPSSKIIAYHLAVVLEKWSYKAEAKRIIKTALADENDFPERNDLKELLKRL